MYTVLLVDDEVSVLNSLSREINWPQFGIETILKASDGQSALEQFRTTRIDLLITDIKMPLMDGLELLRTVRREYPYTRCVLLTAYSEFEYAREALKLGVENYILKPLKSPELEETIEKALDNIYHRRGNAALLFRENILLRWAGGSISAEELAERANILDINIYLSSYCVVIIREKKRGVPLARFAESCSSVLDSRFELYQLMDDKGRFVFIIGNNEIDISFLKKVFMAAAEKLNVKTGLTIAIGFTVQEGTELPASYNAASELLESSVGETVLIAQNRQMSAENSPLTENIRALFHEDDRNLRKEGFKKLILELYGTSGVSAGEKAAVHLSRSIMRAFTLEFPGEDESLERLRERLRLFSLPGAGDDFISKTTDLFDYVNTLYQYHFERLNTVVQTAITYIHKHYTEGLSIKIFCFRRKLSTPYVGYLFKKETGMFFNNYLNQFRIGKAIELLDRTDYSINEIAEKTGFSSVSYFISCFRRKTGISPVKYRETIDE